MKIRKILSLLLAFAIFLSFASCSRSGSVRGEEKRRIADEKLAKNKYVMEVELDFYCSDTEVKDIFDQLESSKTKIYVDGDNFRSVNDMFIEYDGNKVTFNTEYTVFDGVVYRNMAYTANGATKSSLAFAEADEETVRALIDKITVIGGVNADNYDGCDTKQDDGDVELIYFTPNNDALIALENVMISQLESSCERVKADELTSLTIEFDGKRYESATVQCSYDVTISGKVYKVSMTAEIEFDYDERFEVKPPQNVSEYIRTEIENLI